MLGRGGRPPPCLLWFVARLNESENKSSEGEFEKRELYYRPRRKGRDANDVSGLRDSHPLFIGPAKAQERGRCQEPQSAWIQKGNSVAMLCCRYY